MLYLLAGPITAVIGIAAIFFVLRRKSVEKRSMYSARRLQIEHKVRAARQRTLAPHGHAEKPAAAPAAEAPSPFAATTAQPMVTYDVPAYSAPPTPPPPAAPPVPPPMTPPPQEPQWEPPAQPGEQPWPGPSAPAPASPAYDYPAAPVEPATRTEPDAPAWTPAPRPSEPATPIEQPVAASATSATSAGSWSVVTTTKDSSVTSESEGKKKRRDEGGSAWQLASGEAPGTEADEPESRRPSRTMVAVAQYAVLVVGLVMVLIGVLVMVANSHVS